MKDTRRFICIFKVHKQHPSQQTIIRSMNTVRTYIKAYKTEGITELQMDHSLGAPLRLSREQQEHLTRTIVDSVPHEVEFTACHDCILKLIKAYMEREFEASYTLCGVTKMMNHLGSSYTKPTYMLATADLSKKKTFVEETFPDLKKIRKWADRPPAV
jgi:transposase